MNKEWAELNKKLQNELKKESTFKDGINTLLELRKNIYDAVIDVSNSFEEKKLIITAFN